MQTDFDKHQADAYVDHLAEVNKSNQVVATEDVFNAAGALIVPKGSPITAKIAAQLVKHKLKQPIEASVDLSKTLSADNIYSRLQSMLGQYPDFMQVHESAQVDLMFRQQAKKFEKHRLLVQKVTVLAERMPQDFSKGIFCAWLGLCIGKRLDLTDQEMEGVFIAGLVHDIGMLHIAPEITSKRSELTPEEWRALQSHVVVGKLILEQVGNVPRIACQAVLEHHERCDGSGYPYNKFADQLTIAGQVIAICDRIYPVRCNVFTTRGLTLREIIPQLQLNNTVHFFRVYEALVRVIRGARLSPSRAVPDNDMPLVARQMVLESQKLKDQFERVMQFERDAKSLQPTKELTIAMHFKQRLWVAFTSSGILNESVIEWIKLTGKNQTLDDYQELEEIKLMQDELNWQFREFRRVMHLIIKDSTSKASSDYLKAMLHDIQEAAH